MIHRTNILYYKLPPCTIKSENANLSWVMDQHVQRCYFLFGDCRSDVVLLNRIRNRDIHLRFVIC